MPQDEDKQPPSVRESITAALAEQREAETADDAPLKKSSKSVEGVIDDDDPITADVGDNDDSDDEPPVKDKTPSKEEEDEEDVQEDKEDESDETEDEEDLLLKDDKKPEDKKQAKRTVIPAPDNWKNEAEWERTPAKIRQRIIAREAEVASGIKQYSDKARAFDEYEQVLGPRRQEMARIGVSPAQVIGRALEWMDNLAVQDQNTKAGYFKMLADNFGLDWNALLPYVQQSDDGGSNTNAVPHVVQERMTMLERQNQMLAQQLQGISGNLQSQQDNAARMYLSEWAKDKPHYTKVQSLMRTLLEQGTIPLNADGSLNLDAAYNMAIHADPSVRELVRLEEQEKANADNLEKARKAKKAKQLALQKARAANGSLKPGAPNQSTAAKKMNGLSVRDTIAHSLKELRQSQG